MSRRSRLLHDFSPEPCAGCEDGEINLWSRMMLLDKQETSGGDAERVSLVISDLAMRSRGGAQVNLDSHAGHPSPERGAIRATVLPAGSHFGESAAPVGRVGRAHCCARPPLRTGRARCHASGSSKPVGVGRLVVVRRHAASLGPFTAEAASNLSSGSDFSSTLSWGSPDPRLRPFGPGRAARYPASYPGRPAEGRH
jgi:hypothetical protein